VVCRALQMALARGSWDEAMSKGISEELGEDSGSVSESPRFGCDRNFSQCMVRGLTAREKRLAGNYV
jgi:hypothetical protein